MRNNVIDIKVLRKTGKFCVLISVSKIEMSYFNLYLFITKNKSRKTYRCPEKTGVVFSSRSRFKRKSSKGKSFFELDTFIGMEHMYNKVKFNHFLNTSGCMVMPQIFK